MAKGTRPEVLDELLEVAMVAEELGTPVAVQPEVEVPAAVVAEVVDELEVRRLEVGDQDEDEKEVLSVIPVLVFDPPLDELVPGQSGSGGK